MLKTEVARKIQYTTFSLENVKSKYDQIRCYVKERVIVANNLQ